MNIRNISLALVALSQISSMSFAGRAILGPGDLADGIIERRLRADDGGTPIVYVLRENAEVTFEAIASGDARLTIVGPGGQLAGKLDLKAGKKKSLALDLEQGGYILILRALSHRADVRIEFKPIVCFPAPAPPRIQSADVEFHVAEGGSMEVTQGPSASAMNKNGDKPGAGELPKSLGPASAGKQPKN